VRSRRRASLLPRSNKSLSQTRDAASKAPPGVTEIIALEQTEMAKKKDRAFFICPRWNEVADAPRIGASGMTTPIRVNEKTLAAIEDGRPVARSTLRKALLAVRQTSGSMFDVDAYIVDQRTAPK
jgi:hypothetical protein